MHLTPPTLNPLTKNIMENLDKLSKEDRKAVDELMQEIGGTLIKTMILVSIENYIECTYECGGGHYKLRFEKFNHNPKPLNK